MVIIIKLKIKRVRDYIHVSDIARAHLKSLKYLQKNKKSEILNIGTGRGLSILEIINLVSKITNKKIKKFFQENW